MKYLFITLLLCTATSWADEHLSAEPSTTEVKPQAEHHQHKKHKHKHKKNCGHASVKHGDHSDYQHDGHAHKSHKGHYDECESPADSAPAASSEKPATTQ